MKGLLTTIVISLLFLLLFSSLGHTAKTEVKIGVLAHKGHEEALRMWTPTAEHLSAKIPYHSFTIIPLDFHVINQAARQGEVDFILANPSIYVELKVLYRARRISTMKVLWEGDIHTAFGGVIISRADREDIKRLDDLKGKSFMAVHETSLGGWRAAWLEMKEAGINPYRHFSSLQFGITHNTVVYAVRDGAIDAGTIRTGILEQMHRDGKIDIMDFRILNQQKHEDFRLAVSTKLYPEWPFAKVVHTEDKLAKKVVIALFDIPADSPAALAAGIAGWTIPPDYQPVRDLLRKLHLGPYKDIKITLADTFGQFWCLIVLFLVGLLAISFTTVYVLRLNYKLNKSRLKLQQAQGELERRVQERTVSLEKADAELQQEVVERKKLESQLRHAQKMEAIGTLTGGIAHDFNNILTTIVGYGSLMRSSMKENDPFRPYIREVLGAAERAINLIQNLLAFSRKQEVNLEQIDLKETLRYMEKLLSRIIGEDIGMKIIFSDEDLTIMSDRGQIEQVLMNLSTNARGAMPEGGTLTINAGQIEIDNKFISIHGYGKPGKYALISVEDTGFGMDEKTKEKIFEPFFTTKEMGRGTGLGLAMVYGIIKQHNGYINCYSELGKGTIFRIYFPLTKLKTEETKLETLPAPKGGTETILLAEDDIAVRGYIKKLLEEFGYTTIEAMNGADAVEKFKKNKDRVQLLLFDVIMPLKNGKEAYEDIKKIRHDIRVIFISGYTNEIISKKGALEEGSSFISKPILPDELVRAVRKALDKTDQGN